MCLRPEHIPSFFILHNLYHNNFQPVPYTPNISFHPNFTKLSLSGNPNTSITLLLNMDLLNTTITIAQKAVSTLHPKNQIEDATSKIDQPTLTKIMISDSMIQAHYPTLSLGGRQFIKDQFPKFYKHVNTESDEFLTLNDGIMVLKFTAQTFLDAQNEAPHLHHPNQSNSHSNNNDPNQVSDEFDQLQRVNKKSMPLSNNNNSQAPFPKKQRNLSSTINRNTNSLQDTMNAIYPEHEIQITEKINNIWHSEFSELHVKYDNMIELQVSKLRYINSELPFDNKYDVPLRDRIKLVFDHYLDLKRSKFCENSGSADQSDPTNSNNNAHNDDMNINDNDAMQYDTDNLENNLEYDNICVQTEFHGDNDNIGDSSSSYNYNPNINPKNNSYDKKANNNNNNNNDNSANNCVPPNQSSNTTKLERFMNQFKSNFEQFNHTMDDNNLLSNILDIVSTILENTHQDGQSQRISPNNRLISQKPPLIHLDAMDPSINQILSQINSQYHHYIFGHRLTNEIYSLINVLNMVQSSNDIADISWNSINNVKSHNSSNTNTISTLIDKLQQFIHMHQNSSPKPDPTPRKQRTKAKAKSKTQAKSKKSNKNKNIKPKLKSNGNNNNNNNNKSNKGNNRNRKNVHSSDNESSDSDIDLNKNNGTKRKKGRRVSSCNDSDDDDDSDQSSDSSKVQSQKCKGSKKKNKNSNNNNNNNTSSDTHDSESERDQSHNADSSDDNNSQSAPGNGNLVNDNETSDINDPILRS